MEQSSFESMLASELSSFDTPTISDSKKLSTDSVYEDKKSKIYGNSEPRILESLEDGDSGTFSGGDGFRQTGIDTYETFHPGQLEDNTVQDNGLTIGQATRKRLERQKDRYSKEFSTLRDNVTDQDIYEQGAKEGFQNLNNMAKQESDNPWEVGDTSYYRTNPLELGSEDTPLNVAIRATNDGSGIYGRQLTQVENSLGENVNDLAQTGYNATAYNNGKFDKNAARLKNEDQDPYAKMSPQDRFLAKLDLEDSNEYNNDGRMLSNAKIVAGGTAKILANTVDYTVEKAIDLVDGMNIEPLLSQTPEEINKAKNNKQFLKDYFNTDTEYWDEKFGINRTFSNEANLDLETKVKEGDYSGAFGSVLKNFDTHMANSIPEMIFLTRSLAMTVPMLASRVKEQSSEFIKSKGREPTAAEEAGMWLTNAAVMLPEKALLIGPMKSIMKGLAGKAAQQTLGKGTSYAMGAGKVVARSTYATAKNAAFEGVQEVLDQSQENFWKKGGAENFDEAMKSLQSGKIINKNEALVAFIAGSGMGGAIRGTAETVAMPGNLKRETNKVSLDRTIRKMSETLDDVDKNFIKEDNENMQQEYKDEVEAIRVVRDTLNNAVDSENDTLTELEKSDNEVVQGLISKMKSEAVVSNYENVNDETKTRIDEVLDNAVNKALESKIYSPSIRKVIDPDGKMTDEEFNVAKNDFVRTEEGRTKINEKLGAFIDTDTASSLYSSLDNDTKAEVSNRTSNKAKNQANVQESEAKQKEAKAAQYDAVFNAVTEKTNTKKLSSEPAIHTQGDLGGRSGIGKVKGIVEWMSGSKATKARKELSKFTTESLNQAMTTADKETKTIIKKVLKDRSLALEESGIDTKGLDKDGNYEEVKIKPLSTNPKKVLSDLKDILKRKEFKNESEARMTQVMIEKALEYGHITEAQKKILGQRFGKLKERTRLKIKINKNKQDKKAEKNKDIDETEYIDVEAIEVDETIDTQGNPENDAESNPEEAEILKNSNSEFDFELDNESELISDEMSEEDRKNLEELGIIC